MAEAVGVTQSAVNHYLNGTNALNASIASQFAKSCKFLFRIQPPTCRQK
ncbi:helix-turn-helix domain-containing protein [Neisseria gonorrhoeae]|nr:helix-turn-helix transcriptional regulator [Neisseria gonorrhoeae]